MDVRIRVGVVVGDGIIAIGGDGGDGGGGGGSE